jgi:hypothetical protein
MMIMTGLLGIHIPKTKTLRAVLLLAVALSAGSLSAQGRVFWQEGGVVICDSTWAGVEQAAVPDGSGGVVVVWPDTRGDHESVWAQRVDRDGNVMWQENGVFLRGNTWSPRQFTAVPDGSGGMITVWYESFAGPYSFQVTAQRVDASGTVRWGPTGIVVAGSDVGREYQVFAIPDCGTGLIVAWMMSRLDSLGPDTLCVQRYDSTGSPRWESPFVLVTADTLGPYPPRVCSDGQAGACVAWSAWRGTEYRTFAQHIDSTGHLTWPGTGVSLFASSCYPNDAIPLPSGYVIVGGIADSIRAQRTDTDGQILWGPDGCSVYHGTSGGRGLSRVCALPGPDSTIYVVWSEKRGSIYGVHAQLVASTGQRLWDSLGADVGSVNSGESRSFSAVCDGRGGLIVSWPTLTGGVTGWDLYAQRLDSAGQLLWGNPGLGIATDSGRQSREPCVVTDERQGAIVAWGYSYAGQRVGVNVQRIGDAVSLSDSGLSAFRPGSVAVRPNPTTDIVRIDIPDDVRSLAVMDATGRVVRTLDRVAGFGSTSRFAWDLRTGRGGEVAPGVYFCQNPRSTRCLARIVVACHEAGL